MPSNKRINKLTLKELRRKKDAYFRGDAIIKKGRRRTSTVRYIVERTLDAIPANLKKYLEGDKESIIENLTNQVLAFTDYDINPYGALVQMAKYKKRALGDGTKEYLWSKFVNEYSRTYHRYYNYMRRIGYAPKSYYFENADVRIQGSLVELYVDLPRRLEGYDTLEMRYDFSGGQFEAIMY